MGVAVGVHNYKVKRSTHNLQTSWHRLWPVAQKRRMHAKRKLAGEPSVGECIAKAQLAPALAGGTKKIECETYLTSAKTLG